MDQELSTTSTYSSIAVQVPDAGINAHCSPGTLTARVPTARSAIITRPPQKEAAKGGRAANINLAQRVLGRVSWGVKAPKTLAYTPHLRSSASALSACKDKDQGATPCYNDSAQTCHPSWLLSRSKLRSTRRGWFSTLNSPMPNSMLTSCQRLGM
eukprot:scaffold6082_cov51-Phaeocystis_antarctica.AAC.3